MKKPVAVIKDLSFHYEEKQEKALDQVSFTVYEGEWLAIVGHNGSGKSTLAKLLLGLYIAEEGSIEIDGVPLIAETIWEVRRRIGMVFQNPDNQFVGTTVQDDVAFGLENAGIPQDIMVERVTDALKKVNMLEFVNQEPHHLSGGQKQRVAIAGIVALSPAIIILDEATSMLDPIGKADVLETVRQLKENKNLTVISITHDLEEAAKADRIIVMNHGVVYKEGPPELIFSLEEDLIRLGLDIPFSVKMASLLRENGLIVQDSVSEEGLVAQLCELNSKM